MCSLPLQLSEAALQQKIDQAEAAVTRAHAAFDQADHGDRAIYAQLLLAEKKALEQLREQALLQLRAATSK